MDFGPDQLDLASNTSGAHTLHGPWGRGYDLGGFWKTNVAMLASNC